MADYSREGVAYVKAALANIDEEAGDSPLSEDVQKAFDEGVEYVKDAVEAVEAREQREAVRASLRDPKDPLKPAGFENGDGANLQHLRKTDPSAVLESQHATDQQWRDAALASIEATVREPDHAESAARLAEGRSNAMLQVHGPARAYAQHIVYCAQPLYVEAWKKMVSGRGAFLDEKERRVLAQVVSSTNSEGGYLVPTHLDPSIILTNAGTVNPFRAISRVVTLPNPGPNTWNGVSSAGVTARWRSDQLVEATDGSPTFVQPSIPTHAADAFAQASFEALEDIGGLAGELVTLFSDARDRLESEAFAVGSGSDEPTGIFTKVLATTNSRVDVTTQGQFAAVDIYAVRDAVPDRWSDSSTWVVKRSVESTIRQFGSSDPNFTANLIPGSVPQLLGQPVVRSSHAPDGSTTTTANEGIILIGDFSNYVIVNKVGMRVEFIENLLGSNARPKGARGWFLYWRQGASSVNDNAFRILNDHTT